MSMQGSAMMYVIASSLPMRPQRAGTTLSSTPTSSSTTCRARSTSADFDDHLVEPGGVRALQPGCVGVVREAEDRRLGPRVGDLLRLDPRDVAITRSGVSALSRRDELVPGEQPLELRRGRRGRPRQAGSSPCATV